MLVSNDDGIDARGIEVLAAEVEALGTTWVAAPESERSAQSHALTMHKPLRASPRGERRWAISGTPADCVYYALHHLMDEWPAVVISGINNGSNLGNDVLYSGTVAAAMEAALHGVPSVAVSLHRPPQSTKLWWETAAQVAVRVARGLVENPLSPRVLLNVNVPNVPPDALRGVRTTVLGERRYEQVVTLRKDPRGREYFWIGGSHMEFVDIADSDGPAIEEGWATVTPLHPDLTHHQSLAALRRWTDL